MSELFVNKIQSHTDASNHIEVASGHVLYAPGHVVQTVFGPEFGTEVATTSTTFVVVSSSLAASITPKSTSSKIIVTCTIPNLMIWNSSADARVQLGISADSGSTFIRETNNRLYDYGSSGGTNNDSLGRTRSRVYSTSSRANLILHDILECICHDLSSKNQCVQ